jgi:hypothetical protein
MTAKTELRVIVHFPAAAQPFKDDNADRAETIGHLKSRVLAAFGLVEGQTADGNVLAFTLYHDKQPLEDPNTTLGTVAGDEKTLQLKLAQQLTQG